MANESNFLKPFRILLNAFAVVFWVLVVAAVVIGVVALVRGVRYLSWCKAAHAAAAQQQLQQATPIVVVPKP